jgi:hypothetical protein
VRVFPSVLFASDKFDDKGSRTPLLDLSSIRNYALNVFAERRFSERWAVSVLAAWQFVLLDNEGASTTFNSLSDSYLNVRYSLPTSFGSLSAITSVKVPGTYPESEATSTKQIDAEGRVAMTVARMLRVCPLSSALDTSCGWAW